VLKFLALFTVCTQLTSFDQFIDIIDMVLIQLTSATQDSQGQRYVNKGQADNTIIQVHNREQKDQQLKFYCFRPQWLVATLNQFN